ncbi:MAG TPA: radical SAM protein [Proteobacteria bacterium]|nr:radical SAM protein [Pseudomonadota bacterium]
MPKLQANRILLVHPLGYEAAAADTDIARKANLMPPLGLAGIASFLEARGKKADLLDAFAFPCSADRRLTTYLRLFRPGWIGFSCTTSSFLDAVRLATRAREILPGIRTLCGGPHVSALREKLLAAYPVFDYLVVGEGEETLNQLLNEPADAARIPGLVFWDAAGVARFSGFREITLELDSLPFPAYEKLPGFPHRYRLPIFNYPRTPNSSCISSRGCPYACSYCDRSVFRRSFRYNSAAYLYRHLEYLKNRFALRHVNFYDDQFTFNRERVDELCRALRARPLNLTFNCAARAEHLDYKLLQNLKQAGCWMISLGIESGDEQLLSRHRQKVDLDFLAEQVRLIKKSGIRVKGLFMVGLPGESEASIRRSISYLRGLPIDELNVAKFTPFPGSPLYENIHRYGDFDEDWTKMDCMSFQFIPDGMHRAQLEKLFLEFYQAHFKRPQTLFNYLALLKDSPDSWRRFLGGLPAFLRFARHSDSRMVK